VRGCSRRTSCAIWLAVPDIETRADGAISLSKDSLSGGAGSTTDASHGCSSRATVHGWEANEHRRA